MEHTYSKKNYEFYALFVKSSAIFLKLIFQKVKNEHHLGRSTVHLRPLSGLCRNDERAFIRFGSLFELSIL